jgi:hypothetical protein
MWKKIAAVGGAAAIVVGAGTAAMAVTGSSGSTSPSITAAAAGTGKVVAAQRIAEGRLRRALHATWVTRDGKAGSFITHDAIRGQIMAVSTSSITVKAADNVSQTYIINSGTKVHTRGKHTGASASDLHTGDPTLVVGTGASTLTATQILDAKK